MQVKDKIIKNWTQLIYYQMKKRMGRKKKQPFCKECKGEMSQWSENIQAKEKPQAHSGEFMLVTYLDKFSVSCISICV